MRSITSRDYMPEDSVADFARREGISPRRVRALIRAGKLPARRVGRQWLVDQVSVHRPSPSRPLGERMRASVIAALSGYSIDERSASERFRLRRYIEELRHSENPDLILGAWIPETAAVALAVAPSDLEDLARDTRLVKTGFSDPRAHIAASGQLEGRVAEADIGALRREYLLRSSDRPNVFLHLTTKRPSAPLPLGVLLVDLAHHAGVRERSRVAELLREAPV